MTPLYAWTITRYLPGGNDTFSGMSNFFVHTIMYGYYFVAALGPEYSKYIWWKKYLTTFQISAFVVAFLKAVVNVVGITDCGYPWQMSAITVALFTLMMVLFGEFFVSEYVKKRKVKGQ